MLPSSASPPGWEGEFSCPYMVQLDPQIVLHVYRPRVLTELTEQGGGAWATIVFLFWEMILLHGFLAKQTCFINL